MKKLTKAQLKEIDGIFELITKSKDKEANILLKEMLLATTFINFDKCYIEMYEISYGYSTLPRLKSLKDVPPTVVCYLLTNDEKYLKLFHYNIYLKEKVIAHGMQRYCYDKIYKLGSKNDLICSQKKKVKN